MLTQQLKKGGLTFFKIEHAAIALIPRHGELCGVLRHLYLGVLRWMEKWKCTFLLLIWLKVNPFWGVQFVDNKVSKSLSNSSNCEPCVLPSEQSRLSWRWEGLYWRRTDQLWRAEGREFYGLFSRKREREQSECMCKVEPPSPLQALGVNPFPSRFINRTFPWRGFARRLRKEPIEKLQWYNLTSNSRQQAHSCDISALQKKMVLSINLLGKGLTREINEDGGSVRCLRLRYLNSLFTR